jgi:hypothetical protein
MKKAFAACAGALALAMAFSAVSATLPQPKTENGITYVSGGIGQDESAAMKSEAKDYPLSMVFSGGKHNAYLADIKVTIKDQADKVVLDTVSDGPIMLVKVPAGKYAVTAMKDGKTLHRTVQVRAKGDRQVHFHWPKA